VSISASYRARLWPHRDAGRGQVATHCRGDCAGGIGVVADAERAETLGGRGAQPAGRDGTGKPT
jgi:hypothetical protein